MVPYHYGIIWYGVYSKLTNNFAVLRMVPYHYGIIWYGVYSKLTNGLDALIWSMELSEKDPEHFGERLAQVMSMFFMMKPYEGYQERGGRRKKVRFYDEREWRYIPPISGPQLNFLTEEKFNDNIQRDNLNSFNEQFGINFNPDVINYIIVEKENEIIPLMHELHSIKGDFSYNSVELLASRIISMDRIREDF